VVGALILFLLPGLAWAKHLFPGLDQLTRWIVGAGLSYAMAMVLGLLLHYLPGPISIWAELAALNALALTPILLASGSADQEPPKLGRAARWLAAILLVALAFRFAGLGYSEFQGDEALAMITAAEALEGHQDAFFLRGKGPGGTTAYDPLAIDGHHQRSHRPPPLRNRWSVDGANHLSARV
jgi:hypothetical protein